MRPQQSLRVRTHLLTIQCSPDIIRGPESWTRSQNLALYLLGHFQWIAHTNLNCNASELDCGSGDGIQEILVKGHCIHLKQSGSIPNETETRALERFL